MRARRAGCGVTEDPPGDHALPRSGHWGAWVVLLVLLLVVGVAGVLAGRTLLAPPQALPSGRSYALVAVEDGTVQRSLRLDVSASWSGGSAVTNRASGTLTGLVARSGTPVEAGDVLYTVDLAPVFAARGTVPAFRTLAQGDEGADVRQLQRLLRAVGVRADAPDGVYGSATTEQVKAWQTRTGQKSTGVVEAGRLVFVPRLPAVLAWNSDTTIGMTLTPGTDVGRTLPRQPRFTMVLPTNQATLVDPGMPVAIQAPRGGSWQATLGQTLPPDEDGSQTAAVLPAQGAVSVCGQECGQIPADGVGALPAQITVVPAQSGPVVPTAALVVGDDARASVTTGDGTVVAVRILASAGGRAVIDGVAVGTVVRVPGDGSGDAQGAPS